MFSEGFFRSADLTKPLFFAQNSPTGDIITLASINSQGKPHCSVSADRIPPPVHFLRLSMPPCCSSQFQLTQANSLADCHRAGKHNNDRNSLGSYQPLVKPWKGWCWFDWSITRWYRKARLIRRICYVYFVCMQRLLQESFLTWLFVLNTHSESGKTNCPMNNHDC